MLYAVTMDFWDPQQPYWDDKPHLPPEQLTYRDAMAVYALRHPEAQGDHAQGGRHPFGRRPAGEARARHDARDDQGFLRDVRRAVPVRRHLDRLGGHRPRARDGHLAQDEREALRRREQRRQAHPLERQRVPHRRRARQLDAAADVLRRQQRRARGARGRLHPVRLERRARARQRRQHERLEAGGHQDLPGVPQLRERLDPDVGRAAGRRGARPLPGLPRQLRAASRSRPAATSGRSTTA